MKLLSKRMTFIVLVVVLLVCVVAYFAIFNNGKSIGGFNTAPVKVNPQPLFIEPAEVSIMSYGFEPKTIKIKQGQAIVWTNKDSAQHQVSADSIQGDNTTPIFFSQGASPRKESVLFTFFTKGSFTYHDQIDPTFKGTIIVQ